MHIRLQSLGASILAAVSALASSLAFAQTPSGVSFETDKASYIKPADTAAHVTVRGLANCYGMQVTVAFFSGSLSNMRPGTATQVTVNDQGVAVANISIANELLTIRPGVTGACVPGGGVLSGQSAGIIQSDPVPTASPSASPSAGVTSTPVPPATGTGDGAPNSIDSALWLAMLAGAVALMAVAAMRFTKRE